ncbi:general transcription factor 3C polypeptide 1-like [Anopheles albimanus]|uniref:general transcription factor 3C polypeptide 1-like n=1 Tax=Anopheles albimanus TaxID=7167 RepID=UPI00163E5114|nr:general transcription factor 3C polypeptide 1-like [Anopheles albimanus]
MLPNASIASILDEEISLEGLEGTTFDTLWYNISQRLKLSLPIPVKLSNILWPQIVRNPELEFYLLLSERNQHVPYDRFAYVDAETGIPQLPEVYPGHRFRYNLIERNGVRGSCEEYETRSPIPRDELQSISWTEVEQRYGRRFVIVASQRLRESFLIPGNCTTELTGIQYCMLEWIGRARFNGETSQGRFSLLEMTRDSSTLYYNRKVLCGAKLVTRQTFCMRTGDSSTQGVLFHLPRYYREMKTRQQLVVERVVNVLQNRPFHMADYAEIKQLVLGKTEAKKIFRSPEFARFVRMDEMVPYRTLYPDAPPSDWMSKKGDEKTVRVMRLVDPTTDVYEVWCRDGIEEDAREGFLARADSSALYVDKPLLRLAYEVIGKAGTSGISQSELATTLGLDRLNARSIVRNLVRLKVVESQSFNEGRQRTTKFFLPGCMSVSLNLQREMSQFVSLQRSFLESQSQPAQEESNEGIPEDSGSAPGVPDPGGDIQCADVSGNVDADADSLDSASVSSRAVETTKLPTDIVTDISFSYGLELAKPIKGITSNFRKANERLLGRCNFILELLKHEPVIEPRRILKKLNQIEMVNGYTYRMCGKSVLRLIARLATDRLVMLAHVKLRREEREVQQMLVCLPSIKLDSSVLQSKVALLRNQFAVRTTTAKEEQEIAKKHTSESAAAAAATTAATIATSKTRPSSNRCRGYPGCLAKCMRMRLFHEYAFYLTYVLRPDASQIEPSELSEVDLSDLEPHERAPVYSDTSDWKMFVSPLSRYDGYDGTSGWSLLLDLTARMPLVMFCSISTYAFYTNELEYYLDHRVRRYIPLRHLPPSIRAQVFQRRRYVHLIYDLAKLLCWAGLMQIGPQLTKARDQTFVYVRRNVSLLDTRPSRPGYIEIEERQYEQLAFRLETLADVHEYWDRLYDIANHTRINIRSTAIGQEVFVQKVQDKPAMLAAISACSIESGPANDCGALPPGDGRGAAGMDSSMFVHLRSNWNKRVNLGVPVEKLRLKVVRRRLVKGGLEKRQLAYRVGGKASDRAGQVAGLSSGSVPLLCRKPMHQGRKLGRRMVNPRKQQLSRRGTLDEVDRRALRLMTKQRSKWDESEDQVLLMCRVALMYLYGDPLRPVTTINMTTIRDILHWSCGRAQCKTSNACGRRLQYMVRHLPHVAEQLRMYLEQCKLHPSVTSQFGAGFVGKLRQYFPNKEEFRQALQIHFIRLVALLRGTVLQEHSSESLSTKGTAGLRVRRGRHPGTWRYQSEGVPPPADDGEGADGQKRIERLPRTLDELLRRYNVIETIGGGGAGVGGSGGGTGAGGSQRKLHMDSDPHTNEEIQLYKYTIVMHSAIANSRRSAADGRLQYIYRQCADRALIGALWKLRSMQVVSVTQCVKASNKVVLGRILTRQDELCYVSISYQQQLTTSIPLELFVPVFGQYVKLLVRDEPYTFEDGSDGLVLLLGELIATCPFGDRRLDLRIDQPTNYIEMNPDVKPSSSAGCQPEENAPSSQPSSTGKQQTRTRKNPSASHGTTATVGSGAKQLRFVDKRDVTFLYLAHPIERLLKLPLEYFHFFCLLDQLQSTGGRRLLAQTFKIDEQRPVQCSLPNCRIIDGIGDHDLVRRCLALVRDREDLLERIKRHDAERAKHMAPRATRTDPALLFDVREDNLLLFFGKYITKYQQECAGKRKRDVNREQQRLASLNHHSPVNMAELVGECLRFDAEMPDYRWLDRCEVQGTARCDGDVDEAEDDGGADLIPGGLGGASTIAPPATAGMSTSGLTAKDGSDIDRPTVGLLRALSEKVHKLHNFYEIVSMKMHIHLRPPPPPPSSEANVEPAEEPVERYGSITVPLRYLPEGAQRRRAILLAMESEVLWPLVDVLAPLLDEATALIERNSPAGELLAYIEGKGKLGATVRELRAAFVNHEQLAQHLERFRSMKVLLRTGVRTITYVYWRYVNEWLIRSYLSTNATAEERPTARSDAVDEPAGPSSSSSGHKKRKLEQTQPATAAGQGKKKKRKMGCDDASGESDEDPNDNDGDAGDDDADAEGKPGSSEELTEPSQPVLLSMAPWIQLNGSINKRLLYRWLTAILLYTVSNPGVTLAALYVRFNMMSPFHLRQLVELLGEYGCVSQRAMQIQAQTPSLFSVYKPATFVPVSEFLDDEQVFIEATPNALSTLSLCIGEYQKYAKDIFLVEEARRKRTAKRDADGVILPN